MELSKLQQAVKELKKSIKSLRSSKSLIEEIVEEVLLQQKSAFEQHVEVPVVGKVISETGEVVYNKPIDNPDIQLEQERLADNAQEHEAEMLAEEAQSPKDVETQEGEVDLDAVAEQIAENQEVI